MSATAAAANAGALTGRVVLIVGAHGGLGQTASIASARAGATVVLLGRKVPKLNRVHDAIASEGGEALLYPLDMEGASPDDYAELAARIEAELGRLDGVLHCAAEFGGLSPLANTDPAAFARAVHVNVTAPCWLTQACLPLLKRSHDAAIVFAVDDVARVTQAYWGGYGVAQQARAALVSILHAELAASCIRVSGLQPGPMRTALRARAYVEDSDRASHDPMAYADACVTLLSADGASHRGQVWSVRA
ncbi:MAG: SDR family NAD(P)-dependent oxidoreductase [Luteimonas sp.]